MIGCWIRHYKCWRSGGHEWKEIIGKYWFGNIGNNFFIYNFQCKKCFKCK